MPTTSLTYSLEEIKQPVSEDAVRRGYTGVKVQIELAPVIFPEAILQRQTNEPNVRAYVTGTKIHPEVK